MVAAANLQLGESDTDTIAKKGDAKAGLVALEGSGIGAGALLPHEMLVAGRTSPTGSPRACAASTASTAPWRRRRGWRRTAPRWSRRSPRPTASTSAARDTLDRVREAAHARGRTSAVGRRRALNDDFIDAVYGNFPLMIALIGIVTFLLLARAFRSLLLPAKAVVLNVLSIAAAWGVLVLVWQKVPLRGDLGHPVHRLGAVMDPADDLRVPVRALDGLRGVHPGPHARGVRRHRLDHEAVVRGIGRTGRLVTSAALILFLAFVVAGLRARDRREDAGHRAGGRDPVRRDRDQGAAGARGRVAVRPLELVAAGAAGAAVAREAVDPPTRGGCRRARLGSRP